MDPNIKRITRAPGKCMVFALGFLFVGLSIAVLSLTLLAERAESGDIGTVGGVFVFFGAIIACIRVGVTVDRQQRVVTAWWGLLVPLQKTEHPFSQVQHVTLSREKRQAGRGSTYDVFPVRLEAAGSDAITLREPRDYDEARRLAEEIAKFVRLGMRDRSSGEEVAREAGTLDESLQQRLKRAGKSMPLPAQPSDAKAIFRYGGTQAPTTIEIPPIAFSGRSVLLVIFSAGFATLVIELLYANKAGMEIGVRALLLFSFILVLPLLLLLRDAILRERLVVSRDELVVTRRDIFGTKTTRMTSSEIEQVDVTRPLSESIFGGKTSTSAGTARVVIRSDVIAAALKSVADASDGRARVVIRSDRGSIEVGEALRKQEELKWLREVLVHVLTSASS